MGVMLPRTLGGRKAVFSGRMPAMSNNEHIVIAIDGPAASGKGTLARRLAAHLGFAYLDTGTLYRAVGKAVLDAGGNPTDVATATNAAQNLDTKILGDPVLRQDQYGTAASIVSQFPSVREALFDFQRNFAAHPPAGTKGVIMDGRDIGTVICPDADIKFFVTASVEKRAERRLLELQQKGLNPAYKDVLSDMKARDSRDSDRDIAPLKPTPTSHILDTSEMGADAAFNHALKVIKT